MQNIDVFFLNLGLVHKEKATLSLVGCFPSKNQGLLYL